jgi:hypothetical protein
MTPITIPPAALEAGARVICNAENPVTMGEARALARAAFLAMIEAWPGMNTGPNIYGRQDAIMHIPLSPQESAND